MLEHDRDIEDHDTGARVIAAGRHASFFAISVAVHAILIALAAILIPAIERPHHDWVLAYMVELGNGGAKGGAESKRERKVPSVPSATIAMPRHTNKPRAKRPAQVQAEPSVEAASIAPVAAATPTAATAEAHASAVDSAPPDKGTAPAILGGSGRTRRGAGIGSGTGDSGPGVGEGAPGDSLAHAEYGEDPLPPYPSHSRRDGEEGTVLLHVLVGANGTVERVELAQSSGFDALDDAAVDTVRERWRFVPARHDGVVAESWVLVPIRFALSEASANQ